MTESVSRSWKSWEDGQRQRFLVGGGLQGGVAVLAQDPRGDLQHGGLVVDDEDRLPASPGRRAWRAARCRVRRRGGRAGGREEEAEGGAGAFLGVDAHAAAGLGDDAVHGGQPQAGALALRLGREERLEDVGRDLALMPVPVSLTASST